MKLESILEISSVEAINCSACSSEIKFKSLDKCNELPHKSLLKYTGIA